MQLNNTDKAIEYYMEAVKRNDNTYTAPMYMKKAALAYEIKGDYANALNLYQNIKTKYYSSSEASDIDKYIARAEVKEESDGYPEKIYIYCTVRFSDKNVTIGIVFSQWHSNITGELVDDVTEQLSECGVPFFLAYY